MRNKKCVISSVVLSKFDWVSVKDWFPVIPEVGDPSPVIKIFELLLFPYPWFPKKKGCNDSPLSLLKIYSLLVFNFRLDIKFKPEESE